MAPQISPPAGDDNNNLRAQKKTELDRITGQRKDAIVKEAEHKAQREEEASKTLERQQGDSLQEAQAAATRGEEREGWRKEKHQKERDAVAARQKAEAERVRLAESKKKAEEDDRRRDEQLHQLHEQSVLRRIAAKRKRAEEERSLTDKTAEHQLHQEELVIDMDEKSRVETVKNAERREARLIAEQEARTKSMADEKAKAAKRIAARDRKRAEQLAMRKPEGEARDQAMHDAKALEERFKMQIEAERRRAWYEAEELRKQKMQELGQKMENLRDEAKDAADDKREKAEGRKQGRDREAKQIEEAKLKFIGDGKTPQERRAEEDAKRREV